jgi:hypothetical protein
VVALHVRGRAREAVVDLPRGVRRRRGRAARRLPDHLPVRGRLAHHERRGRADLSAARNRDAGFSRSSSV